MDTFQALGVTLVGIIPGAWAVWAFERHAGSWGLRSPDRIYRFVGTSALIGLFFAPVTYWLWTGKFHSDLSSQASVPPGYWLVLFSYLVIPGAVGFWLGKKVESRQSRIGRWIRGPNAAPTAWDHLFGENTDGIVRVKLKSGTWLGGLYGPSDERLAYASSYPAEQSLLLLKTVKIDALTGSFELVDSLPVFDNTMVLIEATEIEYLLFDRR
jgi:hypothetical protein